MALEGSIKEFGLADILQLLYFQRKTGLLSIQGPSDVVRLLFYEGNIVSVESRKRPEARLGMILQKKGLISKETLQEALKEQAQRGGRLGHILLRKGLPKEALRETLTQQFTDIVTYLFTWREGRYEFRPQGVPIDKEVPISLDTQHLLMEGLRILDEWSLLKGKITLDTVFVRTGAEEPELSEQELSIYRLVDGENDVSAIVALSGLDSFQVSKALLALYDKGLIEQKVPPPPPLKKLRPPLRIPDYVATLALAAMLLLALLLSPRGLQTEASRTSQALDSLRFTLELHKLRHGSYPQSLGALGDVPLQDAWGRPFVYRPLQEGYLLLSTGPDGLQGSGDDLY